MTEARGKRAEARGKRAEARAARGKARAEPVKPTKETMLADSVAIPVKWIEDETGQIDRRPNRARYRSNGLTKKLVKSTNGLIGHDTGQMD